MRTAHCLAALLAVSHIGPPAWAEPPEIAEDRVRPPALVLLLAVDQLRRDRFDAALPGGLGRIAREGRVYTEALLDHSSTETCPGHSTMLSGRHPGVMGVPGNMHIDRATGERLYCVEDRSADAAVLGNVFGTEGEDGEADPDPEDGRSPRKLRFGGLGGWMKQAHAETRVYSVSGKDRSAIAMTGRDAEVAYWVEKTSGGFTTSRYYQTELSRWVREWNAAALTRLPSQWTHPPEGTPMAGVARPDAFEGESDERSRTSPHPLNEDDREERAGNLWSSPYLDTLTLEFARSLIEHERLGLGPRPDLLAVSLSATDTVGHAYGPGSAEARDALSQLDRDLGDFLDFLAERFGENRVLIVLTADHGVLPLPEWLAVTGGIECPVDGGRQGVIRLIVRLLLEMHLELSPFSWPGLWLDVSGQLTVTRQRARAQGVPIERAISVAERWLEEQPVIREAWTAREIASGVGPIAALYRNSFDAERSGDLVVQIEPGCLIDYAGSGTTHGSPYVYDRAIPIAFYGPGVAPGRVVGPAAAVDIAPTLAAMIGLVPPAGLDGRDLLSSAKAASSDPTLSAPAHAVEEPSAGL